MNTLGGFIKDHRKKIKLKLIDLSKITGVSQAYLSQVETGKRNPSLKVINKLAIALNLELADLLELQKDIILVKTNRVSDNIKLHKLIETLENANLLDHELDYILEVAYSTLKYIQAK